MDKISEELKIKYNIDKGMIRKGYSIILWNRWYLPDLIENKYMPWWSEENELRGW